MVNMKIFKKITNPTILILTSILIIIYLNNPISITKILIKVAFLFLCYYLYINYYENPNKFIKGKKNTLKINENNDYLKGLRYDKSLETLINKYNYWYQKALKNPKKLDRNLYLQYFDNVYLYYSEIINKCSHILTRDSPSEIKNLKSYRSIRQYMSNLTSEINNLRALIINNNISHKFNNNALNRMVAANDMEDYLYSANYTVK